MSEYKYIGNYSAAPAERSQLMYCEDCKVSFTGCWDNSECPLCHENKLITQQDIFDTNFTS